MSLTNISDKVTTTTKTKSTGIFPVPVTVTDAMTFGMILAKCRKLEVQRRMRKGKDPRTDPEVKAIESFCDWANKLAWAEAKKGMIVK